MRDSQDVTSEEHKRKHRCSLRGQIRVCHLEYLSPALCEVFIDQWLHDANRQLTEAQRAWLRRGVIAMPNVTPFSLRLLYRLTEHWTSYNVDSLSGDRVNLDTILPRSTPDADGHNATDKITLESLVEYHFVSLERTFGRTLTRWTLGLLSISSKGLSETELEDLLSSVDAVLHDVFEWWTPPIARLPTGVLQRLLRALTRFTTCRWPAPALSAVPPTGTPSPWQHPRTGPTHAASAMCEGDAYSYGSTSGAGGGDGGVGTTLRGDNASVETGRTANVQGPTRAALVTWRHAVYCSVARRMYVDATPIPDIALTLAAYFDGSAAPGRPFTNRDKTGQTISLPHGRQLPHQPLWMCDAIAVPTPDDLHTSSAGHGTTIGSATNDTSGDSANNRTRDARRSCRTAARTLQYTPEQVNIRRVDELFCALIHAKRLTDAASMVSDTTFLYANACVGRVLQLRRDIAWAAGEIARWLEQSPPAKGCDQNNEFVKAAAALEHASSFLTLQYACLCSDPEATFQLALQFGFASHATILRAAKQYSSRCLLTQVPPAPCAPLSDAAALPYVWRQMSCCNHHVGDGRC